MLSFFYQTLLPLTMAGTVVMLLLLAFAPLEKHMSSRWRYYVRLVPMLLFTVPFAFALPPLQRYGTPLLDTPTYTLVAVGSFLGEVAVPPPAAPATMVLLPTQVLALIWVAGAFVFACYHLFVWARFNIVLARHSGATTDMVLLQQFEKCKAQMNISGRVRLLICPQIGSPMLVGILRPAVLLPCGQIEEHELRLILLHELTHCKRADLAYKLVALVVKTVHWFNPLAYLLARQVAELCELSCDEALVRGMDKDERRMYALTVLNQMDSGLCKISEISSSFSRGKKRVKRRMGLIMTFKKPKSLILAVGLCAAICLCTIGVVASSALNAENTALPSGSQHDYGKIILGQVTATPKQDVKAVSPEATSDSALQEGGNEEAYATEKQESNIATDAVRELKLIWPIGKLEKAELDEITGEEQAKNYISTPIWGYRGHTGTDISAPKGSEIIAAASGKVTAAEEARTGYGKRLIITHEGGITTLYAHCEKLLVAVGDEVKQGDVIATVGRTGNSTRTQCHFEVRSGGSYLDARDYIGHKAP